MRTLHQKKRLTFFFRIQLSLTRPVPDTGMTPACTTSSPVVQMSDIRRMKK